MAKTKDTRAVIYARYSSHAQRDASIEQQIDACTAYAQAGKYRVVEIYADRYDDSFEPPKETRKNFRVYVNKDLYILEVPYRE